MTSDSRGASSSNPRSRTRLTVNIDDETAAALAELAEANTAESTTQVVLRMIRERYVQEALLDLDAKMLVPPHLREASFIENILKSQHDMLEAIRLSQNRLERSVESSDKASRERDQLVADLRSRLPRTDRKSQATHVLVAVIVVYLGVGADRTVPDRNELIKLLSALMHLLAQLF